MGTVRGLAPECIDACSHTCSTLSEAITAYTGKGGEAAARQVLCTEKENLHCFFEAKHEKICRPLGEKAKAMGFELPTTKQEMHAECAKDSAALEASVTGSLPQRLGAGARVHFSQCAVRKARRRVRVEHPGTWGPAGLGCWWMCSLQLSLSC